MSSAEAWPERVPLNGEVDFTMMYVAHDAFTRDLQRLCRASERGEALSPRTLRTWALLKKQLHVHHRVEDTALWPRLRAAVAAASELATLEAMELEHAQIDPEIEMVDAAIAAGSQSGFDQHVRSLTASLVSHVRHEENEALPLVEQHLGRPGWDDFGKEIRKTQGGLRGGAEYLPWVLDGAADSTQRHVLGLLPPPARVLYRRVWAPRYAARMSAL